MAASRLDLKLEPRAMRRDYSFLQPAKPPPEVKEMLRVGIVLTPDFTLMPLACFVDFLRLSADEGDYSRSIYCSWDILSHDSSPIRASCGFSMTPTKRFGDPSEYDCIVVHGGILHSSEPVPDELYEFVESCVRSGVRLIGLCTGQFIFAELGYLSGKRCAVHFAVAPALRQSFPDVVPVTDVPVVVDGGFITCPGGLAAVNLAAYLVAESCGKIRSRKAVHYLLADWNVDEIQALKNDSEIGLQCLDRRLMHAVGLMRQKIFETGTISEIARGVGVTERELTRLFRKYLRASPGQYWKQMRLKAAHWMVLNSDRSVAQIAHECGFADSAHLIHWFKKSYEITPAKLRKFHIKYGAH